MKAKLFNYFVYTGVVTNTLLICFFIWQPSILSKIAALPVNYYYNKSAEMELEKFSTVTTKQQVADIIKPWKSFENPSKKHQQVAVNGINFSSVELAIKSLKSGDELQFYGWDLHLPFRNR